MKINLLGNGDLYVEDELEEGYNNVYILQLNYSDTPSSCTKVKTSEDQTIVFNSIADGYYSLCKMKFPTKSTYEQNSDSIMYYMDDSKFYKYGGEEVSLQSIIDCDFTIPKEYLGFFSTINLKKEYVAICKEILENNFEYKCHKNKIDKDKIYRRDLLRSAYDIIQYLIDYCRYSEAQQILERISGCNGLYDVRNCNCHS